MAAEHDETDEGMGLLAPSERDGLVSQLARLNDNIEAQFVLIERQRKAERDADRTKNRRRWGIAVTVALAFAAVNLRWEIIRNEQRTAGCHASNTARVEIRQASQVQFAATRRLAVDKAPNLVPALDEIARGTAKNLAKALPVRPC